MQPVDVSDQIKTVDVTEEMRLQWDAGWLRDMLLNPWLHNNDHFDIDEALKEAELKKRNVYNEETFDDEDEYDDEELDDENEDDDEIKLEEFEEVQPEMEMCPGPEERPY